MKIKELLSEAESTDLFGNRELSTNSTVFILYKIENNTKKPVAKYKTVSDAYDMLSQLKQEFPDDEYEVEWKSNYPNTMYEATSNHDKTGVNNWNEIKRAVKFKGPDSDPLHNARLKFGDNVITLEKSNGDLFRLRTWVNNHLGNNEQDLVFNKLGNLMALDKLVQSMRPFKLKESSHMKSDVTNKVWMLTYVDKNKSKRDIVKLFFKNEEDALEHRSELEDKGFEVYTPSHVSKRVMTAKDKLK
jgi:hypothetical protein